MSKIKDRSNRLDKVNFVQNITSETAANYSGGKVSLNNAQGTDTDALIRGDDPDIILFEDANESGPELGVNVATNKGISDLGLVELVPGSINDNISSFTVVRGRWRLFRDPGFRDAIPRSYGPGVYNVPSGFNDQISSIRRAGR